MPAAFMGFYVSMAVAVSRFLGFWADRLTGLQSYGLADCQTGLLLDN